MMKVFDVKDGYAIHEILPSADILPIIITGRESYILEKRCSELGIKDLYQGIREKEKILEQIMAQKNCNYSEVAYIGDDLNDLICMLSIKEEDGVTGCPVNAAKEVLEVADFVSSRKGEDGQ